MSNPEMMIMAAGGGGPVNEADVFRKLRTMALLDKHNMEANENASSAEFSEDSIGTDRTTSARNKK